MISAARWASRLCGVAVAHVLGCVLTNPERDLLPPRHRQRGEGKGKRVGAQEPDAVDSLQRSPEAAERAEHRSGGGERIAEASGSKAAGRGPRRRPAGSGRAGRSGRGGRSRSGRRAHGRAGRGRRRMRAPRRPRHRRGGRDSPYIRRCAWPRILPVSAAVSPTVRRIVRVTSGRPIRSDLVPVAMVLALVTALFGWWAWRVGAYFGTVFYPGAIGVFVLFAILLIGAPLRSPAAGAGPGRLLVPGRPRPVDAALAAVDVGS